MFFRDRIKNSWIMYDWANSAYATTILAAVFPAFYKSVAGSGMSQVHSTVWWSYSNFVAVLIVAIFAPVLGAISDISTSRKRFLIFFMIIGIVSTFLMGFIDKGEIVFASVLFILSFIGFAGGNIFYDGILPHISSKSNIDRVSSSGFAAGYLGGGLLLALNVFMILKPSFFGIYDKFKATQYSFITVSLWWFIFALPLIIFYKETKRKEKLKISHYITLGFKRFVDTFKEIRKYKEAFKFLIAYWLYNDGIGTVIKMAVAYGTEIGIGMNDLIIAILITQFVGIPFTLLFGFITKYIRTKTGIFITLFVYTGVVIWGFFMKNAWEFYILAIVIGTVQGGAQALSRSLFGRLIPVERSAEFFGFFSMSGKFANVIGPLAFAIIAQLTGQGRFSIIALVMFFIIGGLLLRGVKEPQTA